MTRLVALFSGLLFFSLPAQADMLVCTQMWCQEGLTVNLQGGWPAGDYEFVLTLDEKTVSCRGKLPFASCDGSVTCNAEGVMVGESGCALPPEAQGFHAIMVQELPKTIALSITRGDGRVFRYQSIVDAQCGYPNGEECDFKQCCSAVLDVDVVWN